MTFSNLRHVTSPVRSLSAILLGAACGLAGCHPAPIRSVYGKLAPTFLPGSSAATAKVSADMCTVSVNFGGVPVGQTANATLSLANIGNAALTLENVTAPADLEFGVSLTVPTVVPVGSSADVGLSFSPFAVGQPSSTIQIDNDSLTCPTLTITVTGTGVTLDLVASPNPLNFGPVLVNTSTTQQILLTNNSSLDLVLNPPTIDGTDKILFSVISAPTALKANGGTGQAVVQYAPLVPGAESNAEVHFAAVGGQAVVVQLLGTPVNSALTFTPSPLKFGNVPLRTTLTQNITITNISNTAVQVDTDLAPAPIAPFAIGAPAPPIPGPIQPHSSITVPIVFSPTQPAASGGLIGFIHQDQPGGASTVTLLGNGGGPQIQCTPLSVDFGTLRVNSQSTSAVICSNVGTTVSSPMGSALHLLGLTVSSKAFQAQFDPASAAKASTGLQPGDTVTIDVTYHPLVAASDKATLSIANDGGQGLPLVITLTGTALELAPCQFTVSPQEIDFGNVSTYRQQKTRVTNTGTDACLVSGFNITQVGTSFSLVSLALGTTTLAVPYSTVVVPAAGWLDATVQFAPPSGGIYSGELRFQVSNPSSPNQSVPLQGTQEPLCLTVAPTALDFGEVGLSRTTGHPCSSAPRTFTVFNSCPTPITLLPFTIQPGPSDSQVQFAAPSVSGAVSLPTTLQPGLTGLTFTATFDPSSLGAKTGEIIISDAEESAHLLVSLSGVAVSAVNETDTITVNNPRADILWLLDVDDDPGEGQIIADAMPTFIAAANALNIDYRMAVTTDDNQTSEAENGRLLPCAGCHIDGDTPEIVDPTTVPESSTTGQPDPATALTELVNSVWMLGQTPYFLPDEQFFQAGLNFLEIGPQPGVDFLRPDTFFALILDNGDNEDDRSTQPTNFYVNYYQSYFANSALFSFNYINPSQLIDLPNHLGTMISDTNGFQLDTLDPNWASGLTNIWSTVISAATYYPLAGTPTSTVGITVEVAPPGSTIGQNIPQHNADGTSNWNYLTTVNAISFAQTYVPAIGSTVSVTYPIGCN